MENDSHGFLDNLMRQCDRIAAQERTIRAFVAETYSRKAVRARAEALLNRYPDPAERPPLFGVTVGVKDIFHCDGWVTRCGTALPPELFQGPEAEAVTRLKNAGALIMGKTVTTEFAFLAPGPTCNPRNPDHTPGGSSSGSAAGVAAGFFSCALGTQTVGSVIRPAAFCGIVGFKPTYGRVSTAGVVAFSPTADHVGIFCRQPSEAGRLMALLTPDWQAAAPPSRVRLAIPSRRYLQQAAPEALAAFRLQVERLRTGGCEILEVGLPEDVQGINDRHGRLIAAEMARQHAGWFQRYRDRYRTETRELIDRGLRISEAEMAALRPSYSRLRTELETARAAEGIDAWLSPATVSEAPRGLAATGSPVMNLPWTHAGLPTITLPAGVGPSGMPLGLQVAGAFMADEALLALAESIACLLP